MSDLPATWPSRDTWGACYAVAALTHCRCDGFSSCSVPTLLAVARRAHATLSTIASQSQTDRRISKLNARLTNLFDMLFLRGLIGSTRFVSIDQPPKGAPSTLLVH